MLTDKVIRYRNTDWCPWQTAECSWLQWVSWEQIRILESLQIRNSLIHVYTWFIFSGIYGFADNTWTSLTLWMAIFIAVSTSISDGTPLLSLNYFIFVGNFMKNWSNCTNRHHPPPFSWFEPRSKNHMFLKLKYSWTEAVFRLGFCECRLLSGSS